MPVTIINCGLSLCYPVLEHTSIDCQLRDLGGKYIILFYEDIFHKVFQTFTNLLEVAEVNGHLIELILDVLNNFVIRFFQLSSILTS